VRRHPYAGDAGYTMTELAIVVVLIGVLAAIAIPIFLHQRQAAWDASVKSDLRDVWIAAEAARTSAGDTSSVTPADLKVDDPMSPGNTVSVHVVGEQFCLVGTHDDRVWVRDESSVRLAPATDCGGTVLVTLP